MVAHLPVPRLPVHLLFVFLAVHVHVQASHAAPPPPPLPSSYDGSICLAEPFNCGGVNISYPFYLADATREAADYKNSYSCGYTDLKIFCQGEGPTETPVITLGGENYTVQNIFYDSLTIILVDSDVLAVGSGSCPAVRHNVSFDGKWLHNSSAFHNITFFFGCDTGPLEFVEYKIKCLGFKNPLDASKGEYSFVLMPGELDTDKHLEQELATNCSKVVTVPVRSDFLRAINPYNFTSGGYGDVLKGGFELEWSRLPVTADQCDPCEKSEGKCAYSQTREFMGCLCDGGKVGNPDCKHIVKASTSSKSF